MTVSRMNSSLNFLMSSLAVCLWSCIFRHTLFVFGIAFFHDFRRFVIRARVGDDILDFSGSLIALATLGALCWIMSVTVSLMLSMLSNCYSFLKRLLYSSWNLIFFDHIRVTSTIDGLLIKICFLYTFTSSLILLITIPWSRPMLTWLMAITFVTMFGLFVRMLLISALFLYSYNIPL